jgi:nuclear GTP-binding protein
MGRAVVSRLAEVSVLTDLLSVPLRLESKKDPGIPSLWPYKEKLLDEIEQNKRKVAHPSGFSSGLRSSLTWTLNSFANVEVEEAKERQKKLRSDALNRSRDMDVEEDDELENLEQLVESAQSRTTDFEVTAQEEEEQASGNHKDNSLKAYYREFKKVVEAADVILEVLDARDPAGCRCKEVEQTILAAGPRKRIVLILNKIGKCPNFSTFFFSSCSSIFL